MDAASENIRNVVFIGHKAAGKTSLVEALMYVGKATPKLGAVADGSSILDDTPEEKERGTTLEMSVAHVKWGEREINLIDTPGEAGFWADTRMALSAVELAVLVVSARDGIQPGTERLYKMVRELGLPCAVVITKMDAEHARPDEVVAALRAALKLPVAVMEVPLGAGTAFQGVVSLRDQKAFLAASEAPNSKPAAIPADAQAAVEKARAQLIEDVATTDDALTERFLSDGTLAPKDVDQGLLKAVARGGLVPIYFASGTAPKGIVALLDGLADLGPAPTSRKPFKGHSVGVSESHPNPPVEERLPSSDVPLAAFIFKTRVDPHAGRFSYVRVLSGVLRPDSHVLIGNTGTKEHVGLVVRVLGKETKQLTQAVAGDIVVCMKLKTARTAETLCDEKKTFALEKPVLPPPLLSRTIHSDAKGSEDKIATALARMADEDPSLIYGNDEVSRGLVISGPATVHLDLTLERVKRRTQLDAHLGPPKIPYKETISKKAQGIEGKHKKQSGGHGQFGVCYIDLEPTPRGTGFVFEDAIVGGSIPRNFIPSVEKGIVKSAKRGFLAGHQVVDFKVRLYDGKYHDVDSSDAAFQIAGSKAFKEAMAHAGPTILEPVVKMEVVVPQAMTGDVIGDMNSRRGRILGTNMVDDSAVITAYVAMAESFDYEARLNSMTQGKGTFTFAFDHYEPCPPLVQEKVIKDSGFKAVDEDE